MRSITWGLLALLLSSCAPDLPPTPANMGESPAQQLLRVAPFLRDARFSDLLDFESPDDAVFVAVPGKAGGPASDHAFSGHGSYRIESSASQFSIKLNSLLAGRPFPGEWTLIGGYLFSPQALKVNIHLESPSAPANDVDVPAGVWTPVFMDAPTTAVTGATPALVIELRSPHGAVWCDDVMLINNHKLLTAAVGASTTSTSEGAWHVVRHGTQLSGGASNLFHFSLANADFAPNGWICDEANALRARFHSLEGKTLTIYNDGRAYWNGEYRPMSGRVRDAMYAQQNVNPASIEVVDNMGRVDRNTPGDANNDGYNESTGSYRIIAGGPRIEVRFAPAAGSPDPRPVLEFSELPFGKVLATLEGRLVEVSQRTSDGHVLIELPATVDRAVTVDVRIEN